MANSYNTMIDAQDFDQYEQALQSFLDGCLDPNRFLHTRLNLGVYTQKQEGMCMVRAKLPGGRISAQQLEGFAYCLEKYSIMDDVQITTRQDIQFHYIPLKDTADMQRDLAKFNIATREAGGNTVRNITSCQLAGVCPAEHVNVQAYIQQVAEYFVRHPLTQSLPRKFKITFSGCYHDCAQGMVHDLGVIATAKGEQSGFQLLVGGGLGAKPKTAIVLREFIHESELLPAIEAILVLHDKFSDRQRRTRNRIKFLVEKWGADKFIADFDNEFKRTLAAFNPPSEPLAKWRKPEKIDTPLGVELTTPINQGKENLVTLPLFVKHGDLTLKQLKGLAALLKKEQLDDLRTNQDQNLTLFNVSKDRVVDIANELEELNISVANNKQTVVACPGTTTCPLGITNSERVGQIIQGQGTNLNVRINGCQNNCANSATADVGFYGKGQRHHGTLVPTYKLQLGGSGRHGKQLAFDGPQIPAARIPAALERISDSFNTSKYDSESFYAWSRRKGVTHFQQILESLTKVRKTELPFLIRDLGDRNVFQVQSIGMGECAGAQADPVEKFYLEAKYEADLGYAFALKFKYDEAIESLENRLFLLTSALFLKLRVDSNADNFANQLSHIKPLEVEKFSQQPPLEDLYARIKQFHQNPDEQTYPLLAAEVDKWEKLVRSVNTNLDKDIDLHSGTEG